jgi:hypothetical protein
LEEEPVDDQLAPAFEQITQAGWTVLSTEHVVLVDGHPRHLAPLGGQRIASPDEFLLFDQQLLASGFPVLRCDDSRHVHVSIDRTERPNSSRAQPPKLASDYLFQLQ